MMEGTKFEKVFSFRVMVAVESDGLFDPDLTNDWWCSVLEKMIQSKLVECHLVAGPEEDKYHIRRAIVTSTQLESDKGHCPIEIVKVDSAKSDLAMMVGADGGTVFASLKRGVIECECGGSVFMPSMVGRQARLHCKQCGKEIKG